MFRKLSKTISAIAIASLPMASVSSAALVISADLAFAKGKPENTGKPAKAGKPEKAGNGNSGAKASQMKGLNSLKRNINGLMNSSDPKVAGFRSYLLANEALAGYEDLLAIAQGEYDTALADYEALGLTGDAEADLAGLNDALTNLAAPDPETATQEEIDAYNAQVAALTQSISTVETYLTESTELGDATQAVADATAGTTQEDLLQAYVEAMHASGQTDFTVDDITDDMLALFQKHIDDYLN